MTDIKQMFIRQLKYMIYLLSIFAFGYGVTEYQAIFAGLLLGTTFSIYKLWSTYSKVKRFGQSVVDGTRIGGLGTIQRIAVSGLAVLIAIRFPEMFHLVSVIMGLMTFYIVIMIDYLIKTLRHESGKRGE